MKKRLEAHPNVVWEDLTYPRVAWCFGGIARMSLLNGLDRERDGIGLEANEGR